jgi:hypothetical protein
MIKPRILFKTPLLPGLNEANKEFKLQIKNFLMSPYLTFINFETHFLSNLHDTMAKIIFNVFLEAHSIRE